MSADLRAPRPDITYLHRRVKRGEVSQIPAATTRLTLARAGDSIAEFEPWPVLAHDTELTIESPVVHLSALQSGTGSLIVDGVDAFAWEGNQRTGGLFNKEGTVRGSMKVNGNRPLLEFSGQKVIIGLKHANQLNRAVFAPSSEELTVYTFSGKTIRMNTESGKCVLSMFRVNNIFELRRENINYEHIITAFSMPR